MFEGLVSLLGDQEGLEVLGVASSAADAVDKSMHLRPDLVLMDVRFPDGDGAQICERIRSRLPNTAVLFLSADTNEATVERAVMAGAAGYVSTQISVAELVGAIKTLAEGELLVTAAVLARLLRQGEIQPTDPDAPSAPELTGREREIVTLLARGRDNIAIAAELEIEPATVRGHVRSLLEKLGVHSKAQAVDSARRMGLVGVDVQRIPQTARTTRPGRRDDRFTQAGGHARAGHRPAIRRGSPVAQPRPPRSTVAQGHLSCDPGDGAGRRPFRLCPRRATASGLDRCRRPRHRRARGCDCRRPPRVRRPPPHSAGPPERHSAGP